MTKILYSNFLDDDDEYDASERHWQQLVASTASRLGQAGEWGRWISRQTPNGSALERDGNPIYDGRSERLNRAFRIIQHPCATDSLELAAWIKVYEEEFTDLPREELIINLCLSRESSELSERLLSQWMAPTTTPASMQVFIDEVVPSSP